MAILRMLCMGAEGGARRARPRAARCASQPAAPGRPPGFFLGVSRFFPNRFRNFSKGSLEFFQNQFSGAEWARGVGHLEDSEIRNFSNVSLEFFQTHFGICPKGVRNFSKQISEFFQGGPGAFPRVFRKISFPGIWKFAETRGGGRPGGPPPSPPRALPPEEVSNCRMAPLGATLR